MATNPFNSRTQRMKQQEAERVHRLKSWLPTLVDILARVSFRLIAYLQENI